MPQLGIPGMHAKFTDHRIRVVRKEDTYVWALPDILGWPTMWPAAFHELSAAR
jgi:hypothetical protein